MYRVVAFAVLVVAVSADDDDMRKCVKLLHPHSMRCCKDIPMAPPSDFELVKECLELPFKPHSCEREICFAKKKGYYQPDGAIDIEKLTPVIEKELEKSTEFLTIVKENCLNDVSKYGPSDTCDLIKMRRCIQAQMLKNCSDWNEEGHCNGIKDLVEECTKML